MTAELTPFELEALEARLRNRDHASVDLGTDAAGSDALVEVEGGPCGEVVAHWSVAVVGVVMVACLLGLRGAGAGALVGIQYERGAGAAVRCSPTSRYGLGGRPL